MSSMQRVLTSLSHREPDRVPLFLLFTTHGAKELGLGIREYFARPELVAEGQLRLRRKFRHDCLNSFLYASLEVEAWGGETVFSDDAPPNAGAPCIRDLDSIARLAPPRIDSSASLQKVLELQRLLKQRSAGEVPIIGVVISPFSLPVMQLGFESYLELIYQRPGLFRHLMRINSDFCVEWANAQLEAGATAICYFDPVSSPDITPATGYPATGAAVARETLSRIKGPTVTHLGSGRCLGIIDELAGTGTAGVGASCVDDLAALKSACRGKLGIIGNLNGIEMRNWTPESASREVRRAIATAADGGGFILSDNHGEIAWQVPDEVLSAISEEVHASGRYPLAEAEAR